jgi:quinol monooxygenase YgiN
MRALLTLAFVLALAAPSFAQTPMRYQVSYAVTYIELKASAVADGRWALRDYAAASRKEKGNLQFEALEEIGRPNRFAILEAWVSREAQDSHFHNATTARWQSRLSLARAAPDDRRNFAGLYAAAPANRTGPIFVMTHVDVMPPFADGCAGLLKAMRAETPGDPGNNGYDVLRQDHEPNHFAVAEAWASKQDEEAHLAAAHTVSFRQKLLPMTGALYDERVFEEVK